MKKKKNIKIDKIKKKKEKILLSKRLIFYGLFISIIFAVLIIRLGYIQFVKGAEYKESAYRQQTLNRIISPKRGTIYDSTGKALAMSADVDTITINPQIIIVKNDDEKTKELKEKKWTEQEGLVLVKRA